MNGLMKRVALAGAALVGLTGPTLAACVISGPQLVPPHRTDHFQERYTFNGSPLDTLVSCLQTATFNEEVQGRDINGIHFDYSSSSRGSVEARGTSAQPGNDLKLDYRPGDSVSIAHIYNANGAPGLSTGNIVQWDPKTREATVFNNWNDFQSRSPNAGLFSRQP